MESNDQDPCLYCSNRLHVYRSLVRWWPYDISPLPYLYKSGNRLYFRKKLLLCVGLQFQFRLSFHSLPCCLQTTYENFRYRYDHRANPYNKGVVLNLKEIFWGSIPPSKNNFRAKVPRKSADGGFDSSNTGVAGDDIEMGRKAVWGDVGAALDHHEGQYRDNDGLNTKSGRLGETSPEIRTTVDEGDRAGMHSSWGKKNDNWERSPELLALASRMGEANRTVGDNGIIRPTEPRL